MPVYEYQCRKCGSVTELIERADEWRFWRRRCSTCGSMRLKRIYSRFSTMKRQSMGELIDEMRRLGPVNFVPRPPGFGGGPPPGGCPYAHEQDGEKSGEKASGEK